MKRLGIWASRWNHLKTLLPVAKAARGRKIEVSFLCPLPPLTGDGKPELLAAPHVPAFARRWPWAEWSVLAQEPGSWAVDAVISHGVVHNEKVINSSRVPWVAVDHLHENAWWYLAGHPEMWEPFHRVCVSGTESDYLPRGNDRLLGKVAHTGYTAFDGPWKDPEEYRGAYGLPQRYMLVGTAVRASGIPASLWRGYFSRYGGFYKLISGYGGPSYGEILRVLKDYCMATGMAMVGKARWKHKDHPAHALFDRYFGDDPCDPHRAFKLMRGATVYAGGISGLAVEALATGTPTLNWAYYDPIKLDQPGFRALRQDLWIDGIWTAPGIGNLYRVDLPGEWARMVDLLNTTGPAIYHHVPSSYATRIKVVGSGGASAKVLEACGL